MQDASSENLKRIKTRGSFLNVLISVTVVVLLLCVKMVHDNRTNLKELESSLDNERALVSQLIYGYEELASLRHEVAELKSMTPEFIPVVYKVFEEVYIKTEKIVPPDFRVFNSEEELVQWLDSECLPIRIVAGSTGTVNLMTPGATPQYDCDDYAEALQKKALEQGYLMSQQLVANGSLFGVRVTQWTEPHMGNLTMVGDDIYYVESIPPHKVVRIVSRD